MEKFKITSDSGMCSVNNIVIPGQIIDSKNNSYRDGIDITNKEILNRTIEGEKFKTSAPSLIDYEKTFIKILEEKKDVIHLSMSNGISEGCVNSANMIANELNDNYDNHIYVIDTLTGAVGGTLINEIASSLDKLKTKDAVATLEEVKRRIVTSFYVPDPRGFLRSGRDKSSLKEKALLIGAKATLLAGLKFQVDINNGNLINNRVIRSNTKSGMLKLMKLLINEENKNLFSNKYVAMGNVYPDKIDLQQEKEYLQSLNYFENIITKDISGVVAAYGCYDLCGISLVKKR